MTSTQTAGTPLAHDVPADALLDVRDVSLSFGQVRALRDVTMHARRGEVTAIVGDNGAGKSTLIRCISGIHRPDAGTIRFDGADTGFRSPEDAREAGIETVHQNLALVEDLTVWQNLYLNRELTRGVGPFRVLDRKAMRAGAAEKVSGLAVNVPAVGSRVRRLSGGQRQAVAICRAAGFASKLIIMDEPTAALGVQETAKVERLVEDLRGQGHAIVLISHNFAQVLRLSDAVWVMRAGRCVAGRRTAQTDGDEIVGLITGARPGDHEAVPAGAASPTEGPTP
ncbi:MULTISPECIES: ATP-binding cassette domain-containing protein [Phycicoccus]|uniref:ATP-binding cassette domain-containing protein n=1 Tax=Phycicoccus TaxID=367298 RepID=UPI00068CE0E5|nr:MULTISPECIES: ATP-binding cassette domain-containing protein [Phycicoccus]GIL35056.1 sugar ABC transporter ATP-binding protein [Phycicoccus sp. DTK01]